MRSEGERDREAQLRRRKGQEAPRALRTSRAPLALTHWSPDHTHGTCCVRLPPSQCHRDKVPTLGIQRTLCFFFWLFHPFFL